MNNRVSVPGKLHDPIPKRECDPVVLPWPLTDDGKRDQPYIRVGDRLHLQHTVRDDWCMEGTVIALGPRRSWIEVRPDQPITSPANWVAS